MNYENLKIPNHVGIILDGNGRWALEKKMSRSIGHKYGSNNLKKITKYIFNKGIKVLSVFAFSTENFKRSNDEVEYLMRLFINLFEKEFRGYINENIKVVFSGEKEPLKDEILNVMQTITEQTKNNTKGTLNICLNYSGRSEIINAVKKINHDVINSKISIKHINEDLFNQYLYHDLPSIDLLIRTGGELRISNFMLWQLSYAELYFSPVYFPDFNSTEFDNSIIEYTKRDRRYGGINYNKKI